jgi:drug/metabolite transporter (DMT)-like permease
MNGNKALTAKMSAPQGSQQSAVSSQAAPSFGLVDIGLLATILFWSVNFTVVKATLVHIPPLVFNTFRLVGATVLLLGFAHYAGKRSWTKGDWIRLVFVSLVGHTAYQLLFIFGINVTTASNSALLLGMTPVAVAVMGVASGVENVRPRGWIGIALTVLGGYFVVGSANQGGGSLKGDILVLAATLCWSAYTVAGKSLVEKHGPVTVTAYSMLIGTLFYLPVSLPAFVKSSFANTPWTAWAGTAFSCIFALALAYLFWFFGVQRVGPTRTAIYSNLTPAIAMVVSWLVLKESIHPLQIAGAIVIFLGVHLVRGAGTRS